MGLNEAKDRLCRAVSRAGYDPIGAYVKRRGCGWVFSGTLAHRTRSYVTTTGTSNKYDTDTWAWSLPRLVRRVEEKFGGGEREVTDNGG